MKSTVFILCLTIVALAAYAQPANYDYGKEIIINTSKVSGSGTFEDFVLLINVTDSDLKSVNSGGHVESDDGYDIIFTKDDCSTQLDHQVEKYDSATGEFIAWVRMESFSATSDSIFYMYYGNDSVSSPNSATSTWADYYVGVWHMNNNPSTSDSLIDYTGQGFSGEANGGMDSFNLISTGQIGDAIEFDGFDDYFSLANRTLYTADTITQMTVSAWVNTIYMGRGVWYENWSIFDFDRSEYFNISVHTDGRFAFCSSRTGSQYTDDFAGITGQVADGDWHQIVGVYDGTDKRLYIDGDLELTRTNPHSGNGIGTGATRYAYIGDGSESSSYNSTRNMQYYNGKVDEVRLILDTTLSADWIATEYASYSDPSSFTSISSEQTAANVCSGVVLPISLLEFNATPLSNGQVYITWRTASEVNNSHYTVERSTDGKHWQVVTRVEGAGTSTLTLVYDAHDPHPLPGISYYRLKQTDLDGVFSYSAVRSVTIRDHELQMRHFLGTDHVSLQGSADEINTFTLFNAMGQDVTSQTSIESSKHLLTADLRRLAPGIYFVRTRTSIKKIVKL